MKIFRNPETKTALIISFAATAFVAAIAFLYSPICALFVLITSLLTGTVYAVFTEIRYRRIEQMSTAIDKILHGSDLDVIAEFREGELAILKNEISKMTSRLRETAAALGREKVFLTDSIADISHQLRTPLTSANLLVSSLSDKDLSFEKRLHTAYRLKHLISRIDWLIDSLLKLSKLDAGTVKFEPRTVTVKDLVTLACDPLLAAMEVRCQSFLADIPDINLDCDIGWSAEALSNIFKNCMEHNPDGKKIFISAKKTNIYTEITVTDEGAGIPETDLPHIFERFYKGKNDSASGFGIGLSLARQIVKEQNGTLLAANAKNGGAQFTVRFYYTAV